MSKNWLLIVIVVLLVVAAGVLIAPKTSNQATPIAADHTHAPAQGPTTPAKIVPAFLKEAPAPSSLGPTLAPEKFEGLTRDAYNAVREIPVTIAQLPCYCHCDRGFGHKSLYSCFEDDQAAHCAVCVNEALLALKMEKDGKSVPEIRDRIIETWGNHGN